jgi:hypothetical protein
MTNQMGQNLSWFRQPSVSNHLTTDSIQTNNSAIAPCSRLYALVRRIDCPVSTIYRYKMG